MWRSRSPVQEEGLRSCVYKAECLGTEQIQGEATFALVLASFGRGKGINPVLELLGLVVDDSSHAGGEHDVLAREGG